MLSFGKELTHYQIQNFRLVKIERNCRRPFNTLPNDKFLDMTKFKASADDKLNVDKMTISLCDRVENTEGKEENAGYQHFLLFPQIFQSLLL